VGRTHGEIETSVGGDREGDDPRPGIERELYEWKPATYERREADPPRAASSCTPSSSALGVNRICA
jgi:hypothetical protein